MSFVPYTLLHTLGSNAHAGGVNVLAFSFTGRYLASGGNDKALVIWDTASGKQVQRIYIPGPVLSIAWHASDETTIFFGTQDGDVYLLEAFDPTQKNKGHRVLTGVQASVDCLDIDSKSGYLAIGVGSEVQVAKRVAEYYATFVIMSPPSSLPADAHGDARIRIRSAQFLPGGRKLIVSYLNHGIVCWDVLKKSELWSIAPSKENPHMGFSRLSPSFRHILVHNLSAGMDLYAFGDSQPIQSFRYSITEARNIPVMVGFASNGTLVVCGGHDGRVRIWEKTTGTRQQTLEHSDDIVQSIATLQGEKIALLASATSETSGNTTIKLWKAPVARSFLFSDYLAAPRLILDNFVGWYDDHLDYKWGGLKELTLLCVASSLIAASFLVFLHAPDLRETFEKHALPLFDRAIGKCHEAWWSIWGKLYFWWVLARPKVQRWLLDFLREAD